MTVGIIGAMDEEISLLLQNMTGEKKEDIAGSTFIWGNLEGQDIVLVKSGIGKVNAAMTTAILIERFYPTYIINTGSAGGFSNGLHVGDVVIGRDVVQHDVDVTAFGYAHGQIPGMPLKFVANSRLIQRVKKALEHLHISYKIGLIGTGDSFMNDASRVEYVRELFPDMIAAEMEAGAIAQVCAKYGVPFVIIRALSDIAGVDAPMSFKEFLNIASENAAQLIMRVISSQSE